MSLSSFCVVTNALLLNLVRLESKRKNNKNISAGTIEPAADDEGEKIMKKTMKITGMMCPHCSGRVKKCLEAIDGIESAEVSHESGTAIVSMTAPLSDEMLKKTVEDQGYTVTGIE
jgi:Cu2+-exporting ATPase